jgi:hypothetical protein
MTRFLWLSLLAGSLLCCSQHGLKTLDVLKLDDSLSVRVSAISDLDGNGLPELVLGVTSYMDSADLGGLPLSTSIYVYEQKKGKFRYVWKSYPLTTLDRKGNPMPQELLSIMRTDRSNDSSLVIQAQDASYHLYFRDGYYQLDESDPQTDEAISNEDALEYLGYQPDTLVYFPGRKEGYFLASQADGKTTDISLYAVKGRKRNPLVRIAHWKTAPLESISISSGHANDFVVEAGKDGSVRIRTLRKL